MAATSTASPVELDAQWPLKFGASISAPKSPSRFSNVRLNYQPRLKQQQSDAVQRRITAGQSARNCEASIKHGQQEWKYEGARINDLDSYILVLKEDGDGKTATLEKLGQSFAFNLTESPSTTDTDELRQKYEQISVDDKEERDDARKIADKGDNLHPDPENPYDFRHYLAEPAPQDELPRSMTNTPLVHPRKGVTSVKATPSADASISRKRKPNGDAAEQRPKRAKDAPKPVKSSYRSNAVMSNVPEVRISRKATIREPSPSDQHTRMATDDDSGELILENDEDDGLRDPPRTSNHKKQSSMAMALSGQLGPGPISLHSAASSPASRIDSPEQEEAETKYEFDFGGDESDEPHQADDEDGDIDDLELPSPVQDRAAASTRVSTDGADDDDLEEQLARAMAEQEDEAVPVDMVAVEEESEEE